MAAEESARHEALEAAAAADEGLATLEIDAALTITGGSANKTTLPGLGGQPLVGRNLRKVFDQNLLPTLLAEGFCFSGQPVFIGRRRLLCDFRPTADTGRGGILCFRRSGDGPEAPALQDVLVSVDPYLDLARDGVVLIDDAGRIVMVNQAVGTLQGLSAGRLLGRPAGDLTAVPPLAALAATLRSGRTEISEQTDADGNELVISRRPVPKDGAIIGAFGKILFRPLLEEAAADEQEPAYREIKSPPPPPSAPAGQSFKYDANSIIGHSRVMKDLKEKLLRIADRGSNVLLMGESGTGKELFAHAIHAASRRRPGPFIRVNCAAIPDHLLESELFGYVEGAFTGAKKGGQAGKFEQAHNGTIFLDEISDMPMSMQAKLLRVLQEKEVTPLGSTATRRLNMRVVAATNVDLQQLVADGRFRTDLYYRLNIVALTIPPLRERTEDVYFITKHLIDDLNAEFEMRIEGLAPEAWEAIQRYAFPGNIRELRNAIESAFNVAMGETLQLEDLPRPISQAAAAESSPGGIKPSPAVLGEGLGGKTLQERVEDLEKELIAQALQQCDGSKLTAASLLGISRPGLYKKLQKYDLQ